MSITTTRWIPRLLRGASCRPTARRTLPLRVRARAAQDGPTGGVGQGAARGHGGERRPDDTERHGKELPEDGTL